MDGKLYGCIDLVKLSTTDWTFPFDWVKIKLQEMDEVFKVLETIDRDDFVHSDAQKNQIKLKFLVTSYGSESDFFNYFYGEEPIIPEVRKRKVLQVDKEETTRRELPSYLEPKDPKLLYKEFAPIEREKKDVDADRFNFYNKGYGDLPLKVLKALEDKDKLLVSSNLPQIGEGRKTDKKAKFSEPTVSKSRSIAPSMKLSKKVSVD
jgi:hypothetical protein